jgi:hypothetical protein
VPVLRLLRFAKSPLSVVIFERCRSCDSCNSTETRIFICDSPNRAGAAISCFAILYPGPMLLLDGVRIL